MIIDKNEFIQNNKELIDSDKLLSTYFDEISIIKKTLENAIPPINNCFNYIVKIVAYTDNITKQKIAEIKKTSEETSISTKFLIRMYNSANDKRIKLELIEKFDKDLGQLKKESIKFKTFKKAIIETVEIIKPIVGNIKEIKQQVKELRINILKYRINKLLINSILIVVISFILSFCLDKLQNLIEANINISYFLLFIISFLIQTFLIDPYFMDKIKLKLNWRLINKIQNKIPVIESELLKTITEYNNQVGQYEELNKYIIIDKKDRSS